MSVDPKTAESEAIDSQDESVEAAELSNTNLEDVAGGRDGNCTTIGWPPPFVSE